MYLDLVDEILHIGRTFDEKYFPKKKFQKNDDVSTFGRKRVLAIFADIIVKNFKKIILQASKCQNEFMCKISPRVVDAVKRYLYFKYR